MIWRNKPLRITFALLFSSLPSASLLGKMIFAFNFSYYLPCSTISSLLLPKTHSVKLKCDKQPHKLRCCLNFMQSFFIVFPICRLSTLFSCRWFRNGFFSKYEWKSIICNEVLTCYYLWASRLDFCQDNRSYTIYQIEIGFLYSVMFVFWGRAFLCLYKAWGNKLLSLKGHIYYF